LAFISFITLHFSSFFPFYLRPLVSRVCPLAAAWPFGRRGIFCVALMSLHPLGMGAQKGVCCTWLFWRQGCILGVDGICLVQLHFFFAGLDRGTLRLSPHSELLSLSRIFWSGQWSGALFPPRLISPAASLGKENRDVGCLLAQSRALGPSRPYKRLLSLPNGRARTRKGDVRVANH
jgi:hypothetical protein